MTNVSRTNRNGKRPRSDLYSTKPEATRAYVRFEHRALMLHAGRDLVFDGTIWEPAAGEGKLAEVLNAHGFATVETDLMRHADTLPSHVRKIKLQDFMKTRRRRADIIVTNPPYSVGKSGDDFVRHALRLEPRYAAFLLPITFIAGLKRFDLIEGAVGGLGLARVLVLAWRCTLKPTRLKLKNSGVTTYAWFIWERGHRGPFKTFRLYRTAQEQARYAATGAKVSTYRVAA